jgi:alpha-beta hydrolase superfamily lysophospholipase
LGLPGVERLVYPDLRHETLNEPEGREVMADILSWLEKQVSQKKASS